MFIVMMPSPCGPRAEILEVAVGHIVGKEVAALVRLVTRGRNAGLLHVVDDAVVADVRGEVELSAALDEVHVALPLGNDLHPLLAAGLGEVAAMADPPGPGIEDVHLSRNVVRLGTQNVVDPAVAGRREAVVGVVGQGEARVVDLGRQPLGGDVVGGPEQRGTSHGHDRQTGPP